MVLVSVLPVGGNSPIVWSFLSIVVCLMLLVQSVIGFAASVPIAVRKLIWPGLFFLAAMCWAWWQTVGGIVSNYSHPFWSHVPDARVSISADPGQGRHAVMRLLCYSAIFLIVVWTCIDRRRASLFLRAIAIVSTFVAVFGLYAFSVGQNVFLGDAAGTTYIQATFVNRNNYATYAVFGLLANLAVFLQISNRQSSGLKRRLEGFFGGTWIYAIGVLVGVGVVSLTQSRAGALAGLIGLCVFLLMWGRGKSRTWDLAALSVLAGVLIFVAFTSATGLTERVLATTLEDGRFVVYPVVLQAIVDRPLTGHGLGAFNDAFRPYVPLEVSSVEWRRAHNTFLEVAFGLGLPATAVFLTALGLIVWRIYIGTRKRRMNRVYVCFAMGCVAAAAFHSFFDFSLQMPAVAALFAAILGLGYAQSFSYSQTKAR
jgi:O-antigen ligase